MRIYIMKNKQPYTAIHYDNRYEHFKTTDMKEVAGRLSFKKTEQTKTTQLTRDQIELRTDMTTGDTFISRKGDKAYHHLKEFETLKEAREYIAKGDFKEITEEWEAVKARENVKKSDLRTKKNRPRSGKDHRKGKDVTPEQFQEAFGFRGAEFGNWVGQGKDKRERQWFLNETYDALMDLADIDTGIVIKRPAGYWVWLQRQGRFCCCPLRARRGRDQPDQAAWSWISCP